MIYRRSAPATCLPVIVFLVAESDEQFPRLLLEDLPIPLGEDVLPIPRYALPEERRGVFLPPLAAPREPLEAGRLHAPTDRLVVRLGTEELEQSPDRLVGSLQQVFVAHLGVARPQQGRPILHR